MRHWGVQDKTQLSERVDPLRNVKGIKILPYFQQKSLPENVTHKITWDFKIQTYRLIPTIEDQT